MIFASILELLYLMEVLVAWEGGSFSLFIHRLTANFYEASRVILRLGMPARSGISADAEMAGSGQHDQMIKPSYFHVRRLSSLSWQGRRNIVFEVSDNWNRIGGKRASMGTRCIPPSPLQECCESSQRLGSE